MYFLDFLAKGYGQLIFSFIALLALVMMVARVKSAARVKLEAEEADVVPGTLKRCGRCGRQVDRLKPYVDGRTEHWMCVMCAAEMDFKANAFA